MSVNVSLGVGNFREPQQKGWLSTHDLLIKVSYFEHQLEVFVH